MVRGEKDENRRVERERITVLVCVSRRSILYSIFTYFTQISAEAVCILLKTITIN